MHNCQPRLKATNEVVYLRQRNIMAKNKNRFVDMSLAAELLETDVAVISRKAKKGVIPVKNNMQIYINGGTDKEPQFFPVTGIDKKTKKPEKRTISVIDMEAIEKVRVFKFRLETKE